MAKNSTFDITSSVDLQEVDNAINQAIDSGLTAEAAIERVQQRTRARAAALIRLFTR